MSTYGAKDINKGLHFQKVGETTLTSLVHPQGLSSFTVCQPFSLRFHIVLRCPHHPGSDEMGSCGKWILVKCLGFRV